MMQKVEYIDIRKLVLWTENPRDPIDENASDQDIVDRALEDRWARWSLKKLIKEMGDYYDFSELPTVVYHGDKPVVYDGNRRIVLGKIKHKHVSVDDAEVINLPDFPDKIPCNVCSRDVALKNVWRKHHDSGSWFPLERDLFLHKFMNDEKSPFLVLDDETGIIRANPHLNQRFVKEEIFKEDVLGAMGFKIIQGRLFSKHNDEESLEILADISDKVKRKAITTRNNRGKVLDVLDQPIRDLIEKNNDADVRKTQISFQDTLETKKKQRMTKRTQGVSIDFFGGNVYLEPGDVNNLHRDIRDLYAYYMSNRTSLSVSFPSIIRMSLRLLFDTAAKDLGEALGDYINGNFAQAKQNLSKDVKTYLSSHNVNQNSLLQLLHVGAHSYSVSSNIEQAIAISIILAEIIKITHGKK